VYVIQKVRQKGGKKWLNLYPMVLEQLVLKF
jgi:hypothetical protein